MAEDKAFTVLLQTEQDPDGLEVRTKPTANVVKTVREALHEDDTKVLQISFAGDVIHSGLTSGDCGTFKERQHPLEAGYKSAAPQARAAIKELVKGLGEFPDKSKNDAVSGNEIRLYRTEEGDKVKIDMFKSDDTIKRTNQDKSSMQVKPDGLVVKVSAPDEKGRTTKETWLADGTHTIKYPDGSKKTLQPSDDVEVFQAADGSKTVKDLKTGVIKIRKADGTKILKEPVMGGDGKQYKTMVTKPDASSKPNGTVLKQSSDDQHTDQRVRSSDGTRTVVHTDSTLETDNEETDDEDTDADEVIVPGSGGETSLKDKGDCAMLCGRLFFCFQ